MRRLLISCAPSTGHLRQASHANCAFPENQKQHSANIRRTSAEPRYLSHRYEKKEEEFEKSSNLDDITTASENSPPLSEEITARKRTRPAPVLSGRRSNEATTGLPVALSPPRRTTSANRSPQSGESSLECRPRSRKVILEVRNPASLKEDKRRVIYDPSLTPIIQRERNRTDLTIAFHPRGVKKAYGRPKTVLGPRPATPVSSGLMQVPTIPWHTPPRISPEPRDPRLSKLQEITRGRLYIKKDLKTAAKDPVFELNFPATPHPVPRRTQHIGGSDGIAEIEDQKPKGNTSAQGPTSVHNLCQGNATQTDNASPTDNAPTRDNDPAASAVEQSDKRPDKLRPCESPYYYSPLKQVKFKSPRFLSVPVRLANRFGLVTPIRVAEEAARDIRRSVRKNLEEHYSNSDSSEGHEPNDNSVQDGQSRVTPSTEIQANLNGTQENANIVPLDVTQIELNVAAYEDAGQLAEGTSNILLAELVHSFREMQTEMQYMREQMRNMQTVQANLNGTQENANIVPLDVTYGRTQSDILNRRSAAPHYVTLKEARTMIPEFDGTTQQKLQEFLNSCTYAVQNINPATSNLVY
ncbi:hypothetical protein EAG_13833 [Camponotus floridanus]|uniref:Uncharacterized protein n=1 Tax=Camponotus floridanus TaxID=104421 RepID=E2AXS7_CAMFO|nr:hypothetical protein EAG_13833 [Camponotus floridanus]